MVRLLIAAFAAGLLTAMRAQAAQDLDLSVDVRAVTSDATPSRLEGGLGKLRYDAQHDGLRLGNVRLGYRGDLTGTLHLAAEAVAYGDHDVNPVDLTELYAEWRPIPASAWRSRLKVGAFYPEISLENRMHGWQSPYTLSFSAINTWVGEELRTIGAQYNLDWLGRANGHGIDVSFNTALFGWNDPAGTVIATRGWGISDRQSTLFGRFANGGQPLPARTLFYDDLDHRAGYSVGLSVNDAGRLEGRVLHYDNRANPAVVATDIQDTGWHTFFDSLGLRWTPTPEWTAISQWLHGRTYAGNEAPVNAWSYDAEYLLLSWKRGATRLSARYDRFASQQTASNFYEYTDLYFGDRGHAWTLACDRQLNAHWNLVLEGVALNSWVAQRALIGAAPRTSEHQLQLAVRYAL